MSQFLLTATAAALLTLAALPASAATVTLSNTYALNNLLAAPSSNFAPQGMAYDASANELVFLQQGTYTIYRTDLTGQILGSRNIGAIPILPSGSAGSAHHTTSVAADASNYYFTDYTCNNSCRDLYAIGKTSGAAVALSNEIAGYGGYPIDVHGGLLYRTTPSTSYDYTGLSQIRISSLATPDLIQSTLTLGGGLGIGDFAVDTDHAAIWVLDYTSAASLRRYDLASGALQESYALGVDGLSGGLAYANNTLYHYDWNSSSGSTLRSYTIDGLASVANANGVPEPGSLALLLGALGLMAGTRRKARA